MAIQGQGQLPNNAIDPDLQTAIEFGKLVKTLGISFQVRDQNLKLLAGKINSVEELFRSPAFLSRLDQTLYVGDATGTSWIKLTIKKGKIVSFSIISSIKIRCAMLYTQGRSSTDLLYVGYTAGADSKDVSTALPLTDFRPERVPKYFPHIAGETMHDSKELGKFLCFILSGFINNPDAKSTRFLGKAQGFEKDERGKLHFCPTGQIPAELHPYLPPSLLSRQNPCSGNTCNEDMTPILAPLFAEKKGLLIALLFRIGSWFLFLFAKRDVYFDNVLILKPTPAIPISLLVALMKNTWYDSLEAPPIGPNIKPLRFELETIGDGVVVIIDTFAADQVRKSEKGYDLLIQDVCGAAGSSSGVHHIIALISEYADLYLPQDKCCVLELGDTETAYSPSDFKIALKRLDANLIRRIERGCNGGDLEKVFNCHVNDIQTQIPDAIPVSKRNTYIMLVTTLRLYREFYSELFPPDFEKFIEDWLVSQEQDQQSLDDLICSEFGKILNKKIADGHFRLVLKEDVTPFDSGTNTIIVDRQNRRIYVEPDDSFAIARNEMQTINDTDSLTTALYALQYLPQTPKAEKSVRVTICNTDGGEHHKSYFHAIGFDLISHDNLQQFDLIDKQMFLFRRDEILAENFLPLVKTVDGRYAGKMLIYEAEENNIYFGTGKSGAGKSWAIAQALCQLFMLGQNVVIFDVSRTYTKEKLYRMLPREVVDALFCFIQIGYDQDNIPVDLGSVRGCNNLADKKRMIYSLLAAALGKLDSDKALDKRKKNDIKLFLSDYLRDKNNTVNFVDMLSQMEQDGRVDTDIIDTLVDILGEIDEIGCDGISWGDLFEREQKIIVIDLGNEVGDSSHMLLDILAASLFSWQEQHDGKFLTIAVDELKDQNLAPNSPLRSIITDGRKFHTALLGATQDYFDQRHPQLDAMRQANIRSFCRPGKSEERIAETLGFKDATDAGFNTFRSGDVIIAFDAYNKETGANEPTVLRGKVVDFVDTPLYDRFKQEYQGADPQMNTTESSDLSEASQPEDAETEIEEILLEMMESEPSTVEAQLSQPQEMGDSVPEAVDEVQEAESLETLNPEIAEPPKSVPTGVELAEFISETEETLPEVSMPLNSLSTEMKGSELSTVEAQQSQPPETVNDAPELFVDVPETEYSETVEQLAQPQSEPDEPKEDPQILIEQELQKQFRNRINHYSPDYPNGEVYLSELFAQIMEKHHFSSQVDRETMQKRLNRFMRISLDRFDYISLMEILFNEIWPKN